MKHIKGLDTLRAFAVFFVLIEHNGVWFDTTVPNGKFIKDVLIPDGGFGVCLFFVLSGFLITSILLGQRKDVYGKGEGFAIARSFFVRRALRIFPIYYLLLFLLLLIGYPGLREHLGYYLTYTGNILFYCINSWTTFSHTWTLCVEEQFYLLWPWLILFTGKKYLKYVLAAAIAMGVITTYYVLDITGHIAPFIVCNCFDAFGIGALYAYAQFDNRYKESIVRILKIATYCSLGVYYYWKLGAFFGVPHLYGLFLSKTVNCFIGWWLIMLVVNSRSPVVKKYFLENRFLNFIGKISYGLYLYHYVYNNYFYSHVVSFIDRSTRNHPMLNDLIRDHHFDYWIQLAIVVLFSWLSFACIERPFLRLKRFFEYRKPVVPVVHGAGNTAE